MSELNFEEHLGFLLSLKLLKGLLKVQLEIYKKRFIINLKNEQFMCVFQLAKLY